MASLVPPPHIHALLPSLMPSASLLVLKPFYELQRRGEISFDFSVGLERGDTAEIAGADLIVVLRGTTLGDLKTLRLAEKLNKPVIYEIDDNFHAIPMNIPIAKRLRESLAIGVLDQFFLRSTLVRVYSPAMEKEVMARGGTATPEKLYFDIPAHLNTTEPLATIERVNLIFASARRGSEAEETAMMAAIERVLIQRGDDSVRAVFWKDPPKSLKKLKNVEIRKPVASYGDYLDQLSTLRPAIGMAPLGVDIFFRSKTNNKYREYGGLGIPAIYSDVDLYSASVRDGENGLLVGRSTEDWLAGLQRLLDDSGLRSSIIETAQRDISENYSFEAYLERWRTLLPKQRQECSIEDGTVPIVALSGRLSRRVPLATMLADMVLSLGGKILPESGENSPKARFIIANSHIAPTKFEPGQITVVDVTLCDWQAAELWTKTGAVAFALAGTEAATAPDVLALPHPRSVEGLYDSDGTAAKLLGLAERLLDHADERRLSGFDRLKVFRAGLLILPVRIQRTNKRISLAFESLVGPNDKFTLIMLPRLIRDKLQHRMASQRHLRNLRRDKRV